MAAGHVSLGVRVPTLIVLFSLWLSCPKLVIKYNVVTTNRLTQVGPAHVAYRIRFAITKWTKHGQAVLSLCCGDIHPHPGLSASESMNLKQREPNSPSILTKPTGNYSKSKSHVAIAHLNVRSLICRENFCHVCETVRNYDYDIFTISETWLNPSTLDVDISIPGYILFRQDRGERKPGGGVVVYVKNI